MPDELEAPTDQTDDGIRSPVADGSVDAVDPDDAARVADEDAIADPAQLIASGKSIPMPPRRTGVFLDPLDLREHVGALLRVMLGGYEVDAFGNYTFTHEHARIFVTVGGSPIGPQVGVFSVTNIDLALSPDLARFIATTNHRLGFGALSYDEETRTVWIRHTLLGTMLDAPELQAAVAAIASTAAAIDDHIQTTFGGRRFEDAPDDVRHATKPPETSQTPYRQGSGYL